MMKPLQPGEIVRASLLNLRQELQERNWREDDEVVMKINSCLFSTYPHVSPPREEHYVVAWHSEVLGIFESVLLAQRFVEQREGFSPLWRYSGGHGRMWAWKEKGYSIQETRRYVALDANAEVPNGAYVPA